MNPEIELAEKHLKKWTRKQLIDCLITTSSKKLVEYWAHQEREKETSPADSDS